MRKGLLIVGIIAIVAISLVAFVHFKQAPKQGPKQGSLKESFTLKSLTITTEGGLFGSKSYTVLLSFEISDDVILLIIDPNGNKIDEEYAELGQIWAKLDLVGFEEVPEEGNYKLVVKDIRDRVIFTKNFSLIKPVEVLEKELNFYTDKGEYDYRKEDKIIVNIKNVGEEGLLIPNVEMVLFNENATFIAGRGEIKREKAGTIWIPSKETISLDYSPVPCSGWGTSNKYSFKFYSEGEFIGGSNIFNCESRQ